MILNVCFFPDRMNGDSSGYGGANGNGNYVTAPADSPGYYYNSGPNQMMSPQPPMGEQPQPQPQQQQQQPQQMPFAQGHQSSLFHFNSSSFSSGMSNPALARALSTLSGDKNRRPRSEKKPIPDEQKDDKYFERRRRNNEAAKKSRDARKQREDDLAIRASFLEKSNSVLRVQVHSMREEAMKLRQMWFQKCQTGDFYRSSVTPMDKGRDSLGQTVNPAPQALGQGHMPPSRGRSS
ncbi:hepatic leukemia factor isoform X3 [Aplysia californica]|uniref:Hepatic leukemia factor isoform X3 n=1 Tax=Aplysia californica TaxID=6500 RepID=A0ABM1AEK7_APLCA|nr:hepatic leukemia factor isoform X3 [Aplysia californica]